MDLTRTRHRRNQAGKSTVIDLAELATYGPDGSMLGLFNEIISIACSNGSDDGTVGGAPVIAPTTS